MAFPCDRGIEVMLHSLEWAQMTDDATANVRLVAFFVDLLRRDQRSWWREPWYSWQGT